MNTLPKVYLARHGETLWSVSGQHTGMTDIPLTSDGEEGARHLGHRLGNLRFAKIFSSPLQRAVKTAELAGFGHDLTVDTDLLEWNYGDYEGLTTAEIQKKDPGWFIFRSGCPNGESPEEVATRSDRMVKKIRKVHGNILIFAHAHILRMLTTRWLNLAPEAGCLYFLNTASVSILGYEHNLAEPVIRLWNDVSHLVPIIKSIEPGCQIG
ncbi:MAG: histidine phosphatase family protein [Chthoniobacterales bacterium]